MAFWVAFWKLCLVASLAVFSVMAILVTIGGALDYLNTRLAESR